MLSVIVELIAEGLKRRRAVKDIMKLCDVFDLNPEDTRIWAELNSMYSPVIPTSPGESAFAEAYIKERKDDRCWGYLQYMVAEGDVTIEDIRHSLEVFASLEKLVDVLGIGYMSILTKSKPEDWWSNETSGSYIAD